MERVDALIVGGGPAGASCAWALRDAGLDPLVLDAHAFPRTKLCAGWITPAVVQALGITRETYRPGLLTFETLPIVYFGRNSARRVTLRTRQHSIRRYEFDHWLLQRSGARVRQHEVRRIRIEDGWYVVDGRFAARFLVGAGGTHCPVRRLLFADAARSRAMQAVALEEEFPFPSRDDMWRLWFREHGLAGYAWYVPKGGGWVNVGLGAFCTHLAADPRSLRQHWALFVSRLQQHGLVRGHAFAPQGHTYYVRPPLPDARRGRCFLVGDSAGLATRDLAEGIGPAIESGRLAARAIVEGAPYDLGAMTKYSFLPPGLVTNLAERLVDRQGGFFRDRVFGARDARAAA